MGEYTPPPSTADTTPPAACVTTGDVSASASTDVPVAYGRDLTTDVCLDVDLTDAQDELVDLDVAASLE